MLKNSTKLYGIEAFLSVLNIRITTMLKISLFYPKAVIALTSIKVKHNFGLCDAHLVRYYLESESTSTSGYPIPPFSTI
jgi:hypothetical protein